MRIPRSLDFLIQSPLRRADIQPGLYHYVREVEGAATRFHLRVDATGNGLLLANAAASARLAASGVIIAKGLLDGGDPAAVARRARACFRRVSADQIASDVAAVQQLIGKLASPAGDYPIINLADPAFSPKAAPLDRPISADVPLCPPLWMMPLLDRLWNLGIPHVTFAVGNEPDHGALVRAIERAEDLGLITGARGRGTDLCRGTRISELARAGLDHLDICCLSVVDDVHNNLAGDGDRQQVLQAFIAARKHGLCAVAQVALVRPTLPTIHETLEALAGRGVRDVGLFAIATTDEAEAEAGALRAEELTPVARLVEETAERLGVRLLWYPTLRFARGRPLGQQACGGPRCSGDTAIRVEPDGSVIPPRGPYVSAGNLLIDDWETIERSEVFQNYRRRIESDTHCDQCPGLAICAADCPRNPAGWAEGE